jgi:uroporphyrinogen-III synthase
MQKINRHILSTRPLDKSLVEAARQQGIEIEELSFIQTTPVQTPELQKDFKKFSNQNITAIFTSMNAVDAVAQKGFKKFDWTVYCIGTATQKLVQEKLSITPKGTAPYAEALADVIIADGVQEAIFFCGNIRRDVLPDKLKAAGIKIEEVIVYETTETAQKVFKKFDGILFFSPSAVHSFFSVNTVHDGTELFAIGTTTAEAVQQYTGNNVIVADKPGKEDLVQQMLHYYSQTKTK